MNLVNGAHQMHLLGNIMKATELANGCLILVRETVRSPTAMYHPTEVRLRKGSRRQNHLKYTNKACSPSDVRFSSASSAPIVSSSSIAFCTACGSGGWSAFFRNGLILPRPRVLIWRHSSWRGVRNNSGNCEDEKVRFLLSVQRNS